MNDTANTHDNILPMVRFPDIRDIIDEVLEVQNNGKATVFIDISGHVQQIHVRIYAPIWKSGIEPSFDAALYLEPELANEELIHNFKENVRQYINSL